jgi:hypothetical protein
LAPQQQQPASTHNKATATPQAGVSDDESGTDSGTKGEEDSDDGRPAPSESRSFASTYWRPERNDRKANLSVIDERLVLPKIWSLRLRPRIVT